MTYYDCENIPFKAPRRDIVMEKGGGFDETLSQKKMRSKELACTSVDYRSEEDQNNHHPQKRA